MNNVIPAWLSPIEMDVNTETAFSINVIYLINDTKLITYQSTYEKNHSICVLLHNPYQIHTDHSLTDWVSNLTDTFYILPTHAIMMIGIPNKFIAETYLDILSSLEPLKDEIQ